MRGALIMSWGGAVPGREKMGLDVFGKALAYADQKAKEGVIESHEEYFSLDGNATESAGRMIVRGEVDNLLKLKADQEWMKLTFAAASVVQNFTIQTFAGGNEASVQQMVGLGMSVEQEMGLLS
jgi:hypothetical protein